MNILTYFSKNKTLSVFITIILLIFTIGVIGNSIIKNTIEDWAETSETLVQDTKSKIIQLIDLKQENLLKTEKQILTKLKSVKTISFGGFNSQLQQFHQSNLRFSIYQKDSLVYWNENYLDQSSFDEILKYELGETFFIQSDIHSYFSIRDTVSINNITYTIFVSEIAEKQYQLNDDYFSEISLKDEISKQIETVFKIEYSPKANKTKDGRKFSFEILNNKGKVIGIATFLKPLREKAVDHIENRIYILQGFLALFGYLILGFLLFRSEKINSNKFIKFITITLYLIVLRYLLILLKFPRSLFTSELFNDKYYFSNFGSGLAYSPIELLITLILVFGFIYFSFKYSLEYYYANSDLRAKNYFIIILSILFCIGLYILALRGIGASVRGIVFDTSLRYFQDTSLAFSLPHLIMHINALIIGLISIIGSASLIVLIFAKLKNYNTGVNYKSALTLIIILFSADLIYTYQQNNPQLTILLKLVQILLVFIIVYLVLVFDLKRITKIILFFLAASIFSIGSLLFYNTELEKSSLKTTANIISRFDDGWYKNLITETLFAEFSRVEAENAFTKIGTNFNSSAFKIWSKSQLQKEAINSSVNFISLSGDLLGGFGSIYPSFSLDKFIDTNSVLEEIQIFEEPTESESKKIIRGIFPIKDEYSFLGYLDVSILADLNNFGFSSHPEFISTGKLNEKAILKLDKLIILDYRNKELKIVYGNLNPTSQLNDTIVGAEFTKADDAWIETDINNSEYLIYVKKVLANSFDRIIAVALREKELSIGLFDFFKIFFTHALILLILVIGYFTINYKSKIHYQFDLRSKLLLAFLIISLIPLVLTAFYFRNLTEEKNRDAIYYKLGKRAFSVENYINENYDEKLEYDIYRKASDDLNINYSVFRKNKLEYSSHDLLYDVGLFSKLLNPIAYNELIQNGSQEILLDENVDKYEFSAFYYKGSFLGEEIIIEVADGFNNIRLPLSGSEVDVFLFGIYSLAFVFIIIFSAIFANQISLPIRKITSATKSVAAGDLSLELKTEAKGELGDLVSGFQYMIKELKKNQTILAEIEREEAWKEMAKQVAHEIKNPLTPMKLSVQQLITAYRDKSDKFDLFFEKVTETILNQIETLKNIATEFSNFARMPKLKVELININEVINNSINLFTDEKVKISFEPLNGNSEISGDAEQLKRTVINLIRNSIQANAIKINLYTKESDDNLELFVEDNGAGISDENLDKIFETNFTTKADGMGLGLSMARRYMRSTGGNIAIVDSSSSGTIIKLTFPK